MTQTLPFRHNWREPLRVEYRFETQITESRGRKEQRIARRHEPRESYFLQVLAHSEDFRTASAALVSHLDGTWWVAAPETSVRMPTTLAEGFSQIPNFPSASWAVPGQKFILWDGAHRAAHTVFAVSAQTVLLQEPLTRNWPAGTKAAMANKCWVSLDSDMQAHTDLTLEASVRADVIPGSKLVVTPSAPVAMFDGREVFLRTPNRARSVSVQLGSHREMVDYGQGRARSFPMADFITETHGLEFTARGRPDMEYVRDFFLRHWGRQSAFYMPSPSSAFEVMGSVPVAAMHLHVKGTHAHTTIQTDTVRSAIAIRLRSGVVLLNRAVNSAVENGNTVFQVRDPWVVGFSPSEVLRASWMPMWRFASDEMVLEWLTEERGQVLAQMKMLEDEYLEGVSSGV